MSTAVSIRQQKLAPGTAFARYCQRAMASGGNMRLALDQSESLYPDQPQIARAFAMQTPAGLMQRSTVAAGGTTWGSALSSSGVTDDFVPLLNAGSALGLLKAKGRELPFTSTMPVITAGASAAWVAPGTAKPLSAIELQGVTLDPAKVVCTAVFSRELTEASPVAERLVRVTLLDGLTTATDLRLFDPSIAADADGPASLTNALTPITSTGATASAIQTDLTAMVAAITSDMVSPAWVMRPSSALRLSLMGLTNDAGDKIGGAPIVKSLGVPSGVVVLVDAARIVFAGGGDILVDASTEASVQMLDNPSDSAATLVSLWQNNLVSVRVELFLNFRMARDGAIVVMTGATW